MAFLHVRPVKHETRSLLFTVETETCLLRPLWSCAWSCCPVSCLSRKLSTLRTCLLWLWVRQTSSFQILPQFLSAFWWWRKLSHWHLDFLCNFSVGNTYIFEGGQKARCYGSNSSSTTLLYSIWLYSVLLPVTSFSITGDIIAQLRETAMTLFYMRHKHINNGGHRGDGVLAARSVAFCHTQSKRREPNHCNAVAGI